MGPVHDAFLSSGVSSTGPAFDHVVEAPPPFLPVFSPESVTLTTPPRNRIEPDPVEFKSPGVYKLERDNNGKVTGFKY
jgi:hypothetical protein